MQRSKFPYTAKSSALTIRHAVSIDERRSKFRQDLVGETKTRPHREHRGRHKEHRKGNSLGVPQKEAERPKEEEATSSRYRRPSHAQHPYRRNAVGNRQRSPSPAKSPSKSPSAVTDDDGHSMTASSVSLPSRSPNAGGEDEDDDDADEALPQDIQEMWFPGCHAVCNCPNHLFLIHQYLGKSSLIIVVIFYTHPGHNQYKNLMQGSFTSFHQSLICE